MARLRVVLQQLWRCGAVLFGCWQALREGILCVCVVVVGMGQGALLALWCCLGRR